MSECRLRPGVISRSRPDVISNQDFEKSLYFDKYGVYDYWYAIMKVPGEI